MSALAQPASFIDSPMLRTVRDRPTDYWNDSCSVEELTYAVARGATGATSNPSIVLEVMRKERTHWTDRVRDLAAGHPSWTEVELTWAVIEEMAVRGAAILEPTFVREGSRKGRLSVQINPADHPAAERMLAGARHLVDLAPNLQVKFPTTAAGIAAMEEATAAGISINATVSFTVSQAIAVAEAVERGLDRFSASGGDPNSVSPVVTMMIGRLDDWMRVLVERDDIAVHPDALDWAGIAAFKRAYGIFGERRYRARLLAAAFRHRLHWTELVGGDVVLTIPYAWQVRFNASGISPADRMSIPVEPWIIDELSTRIPDFARAYDPDGLTAAEFATFGATVRTLRGFIGSYHDLMAAIRDITLPNPDLRAS